MSAPLAERETAVYVMRDHEGHGIYVGVSCRPLRRIARHSGRPWAHMVRQVDITWHPNRAAALAAERTLIGAVGGANVQHNEVDRV